MQTTFICFSHNLNYALGWMVVHSLWQATAIALLSGVLAIVLRDKTAKMRYLVSNIALVAVLASAVVTFCLYYDFSKEAGQLVFIPDETSARFETSPTLNPTTLNSTLNPNSAENSPLSIDGLKLYFNRNIYLIVTIWALGVALFMLRLLGGISYVYYLKSRLNFPADEYWQDLLDGLKTRVGIQKGIDLLESALVRSPIVIGHLKPVILFPIGAINRLNPNEVEAILAHELAHVLRNDYVFNIIQSVIEALFYFHPAVWWISAQIRNERENCCDDVAIELCGNSMTYAKSLVSVQEMAYYSPQMAMAFAGKSNKNQLLMRVQRVLNQPQNKTNVREKLIATCLLVALMVSLSFSSNGLNRSGNGLMSGDNSDLIGNNLIGNTGENRSENSENTEGSDFLVFVNKNGQLDSLPISGDVKDGTYKFEDKTQAIDLTVKNKCVTQFNINGLEIASADIPKFERIIHHIISPVSPPSPPTPPSQMSPLSPPTSTDAPEGLNIQSNGNQLTVNENGLHLNGTDEHGKPVVLSVDKNGFVMNGNGVSINIPGEDTYEADAKPLDGLKNYNNTGQLMTIVSKNGTIQNFNTKGDLISIFKPNGVIKNYQNRKLVTITKNGKTSNYNGSSSNSNKNTQDPYNTLRLNADNGFSYVNFSLNGNSIWKCYKDGQLLGDLTVNNKKPYYNGHVATSTEMKQLGLRWENDSLIPVTGGFQIQENNTHTSTNSRTNNSTNWTTNEPEDVLEEHMEALKERAESMQNMIANCDFRKRDPNWFLWAGARLAAQNGLINANKSKRGLDAVENELNSIQKQFDNIRKNKKPSNCQNCDESTGYSYSYGTDEQARQNAERMTEQAHRDAQLNSEQLQRNREQMIRDREQAQRDAEQAQRDAEQAKRDAKINAEQTKRNREQAKRDAEQARRDAEQARRDATTSSVAKDNLFRNLVNEGYVSLNKQCTVKFDSDALIVNGKAVDDAVFNRYKAAFEKQLGKATDYSMSFKGVITSIGTEGVSLTGRFHNSISRD